MADKRREMAEDARDLRGRGASEEAEAEYRRDDDDPVRGDDEDSRRERGRRSRRQDPADLLGRSAADVFESLERWQEDVAEVTRDLSRNAMRESGGSASRQMARLLAAQRQMLERVEDTIVHMQELIGAAEQQLEGNVGDDERNGRRETGVGAMLPLTLPVQAFDAAQQMSRQHLAMWSRMAEGYRGLWVSSLQAFMPGGIQNGDDERRRSHHRSGSRSGFERGSSNRR